MITDNPVETPTGLSFGILRQAEASHPLIPDALRVLESTSRTFYIPIARLPAILQETVGAGYLCMRAIDEIEDHPTFERGEKEQLLRDISRILQSASECLEADGFMVARPPYLERLPEVTVRIGDWARLAPDSIAPRIWDATAAMAERMAAWVACNWHIQTEADLNSYTFGVAGAVGLMLSDIWAWYDGVCTDRFNAIGFGRGLQSVNILRNREEDLSRGVDFFPARWDVSQVAAYARRNLALADAYTQALPRGPVQEFCKIPLLLAYATLDAMQDGRNKLTRNEVTRLVEQAIGQ